MKPLRRFDLSATQLIATALGAISATIAASYLGVSGTVIGAAVASVVGGVGNAVFGHSLRSTHARMREVVPARRPNPPDVDGASTERAPMLPAPAPRARPAGSLWRGVAIGSVAMFAAVLAVITGVEVVAGRPISDLLRGDSGSGTSLFGDANAAGSGGGSAPTVTTTVTPSVVVTTPTVTQTAPAVTRTATPTVTASPSPSGTSTTAATSGSGSGSGPATGSTVP